MRLLLAASACLALAAAPAAAAAPGGEPLAFLSLDGGARAVAMGGAYTALAADANALIYNPAGLGGIRRHEATFMHNEYFQGASQEYAAYASPLGLGVNVNSLRSGDVARTTISNPDGAGLGSVSMTDLSVGLGYGRAVGDSLRLGAAGRWIRESIAGTAATGWSGDLGALYTAAPGFSLGAAIQNLGPKVKFGGVDENLPLDVRAGAAYQFAAYGQASTVSADAFKERSDKPQFAAGAETVIARVMAVRLGFTSRNSAGPGVTAGVGWTHQDLSFDYAFVPYGDLGTAHRVSIAVRWGGSAGR